MPWAPSGREVWFTEGVRFAKDVVAVDLRGRRRLVYRSAVDLSLVDIAPDGRALLHKSICRESSTKAFCRLRRWNRTQGQALDLSPDGRAALVLRGSGGYP